MMLAFQHQPFFFFVVVRSDRNSGTYAAVHWRIHTRPEIFSLTDVSAGQVSTLRFWSFWQSRKILTPLIQTMHSADVVVTDSGQCSIPPPPTDVVVTNLLIQVRGQCSIFSPPFPLTPQFCRYTFKRQVHAVLLFLINRNVRDVTKKLKGPALASLTRNLFNQTNTKCRIYRTKKC